MHGHVDRDCSRAIGSSCSYVCDSGCSSSGDKVYCTYEKVWSRGNCTCDIYQSRVSNQDIAGIILGLLSSFFVVSVCMTCWIKRRGMLLFQGVQHTNINMTARTHELPRISSSNISTTATVPEIFSTAIPNVDNVHNAQASKPPHNESQIINPPAYEDINFVVSGDNS
ncbi:hypothetical protein ACJMK2_015655 [Sinanodonta woodiana]|uniref:Uncharacterized protein n=1 Tax=Sinanodonta woodiana TaxID=1069815 RepID=A0ABD3UUL4_SINWO